MRYVILARLIVATAAAIALAGCAWDYLANTDRVSYTAGDAVKANIEAQTTNPSFDNQYNTGGLGKDGGVVPQTEE
jgi:hypothetical protein